MPRKRLVVLASAVAVVALCAVTILTVSSQSSAARLTQAHRTPAVKESSALNWSGYAAETSLTNPIPSSVTDVMGGWTVPSVTGTRTAAYSSTWVGMDGYSDATVEQIGTEQDWTGRGGSYYAWYELYPSAVRTIGRVYPGDAISAEVSYQGNNFFLLTLADTTAGHTFTFTTTQSAPSALRQSAEWIYEAPSSRFGVLPLANFGTAAINSASVTIAGQIGSINAATWSSDPITMVSRRGAVKAAPSALSTDGTSFNVTWRSS